MKSEAFTSNQYLYDAKDKVEEIRRTLEDMKRHGSRGGLPQDEAFYLLEEISQLRLAVVEANARAALIAKAADVHAKRAVETPPHASHLIYRLRSQSTFDDVLCHEAALEIELLQDREARLRAQLHEARNEVDKLHDILRGESPVETSVCKEFPYRVRSFWSPEKEYLVTAFCSQDDITLMDDNSAIWQPTGPEVDVTKQEFDQKQPATEADDTEQLLPCPFCDSEAKIENAAEVGPNSYVVCCQNPMCMSSSKVIVAEKDNVDRLLIEAWNKRARAIERSYVESAEKTSEQEEPPFFDPTAPEKAPETHPTFREAGRTWCSYCQISNGNHRAGCPAEKASAPHPDDETPCAIREDGMHCECWYGGNTCCGCGDGDRTLGGAYPTCAEVRAQNGRAE